MKTLVVTVVVIGLLWMPCLSWSQTPVPPNGQWPAVQSMDPGEKLVVSLKDGRTTKGKLHSVSDTTLTFAAVGRNKPAEFNRENIRQIHVEVGRSLKKSVLIGTGVGAGLGAGLGAAAGGCPPNQWVCFGRNVMVPATAVVFAIPGAVTGFLIGRFDQKRVLIYQAR